VRKQGTEQTGGVYQLTRDDRAYVRWDDGRFVRERLDDLVVASAVDELAALEAKKKKEEDPVTKRERTKPEQTAHLIARKDGVLCTVCATVVPVHPGDGTPLPSLLLGYARVVQDHPAKKHEAP
jgi:hypothetical protein